MKNIKLRYREWRFKNTAFFALSIIAFIFLAETQIVQDALHAVGRFGYFGAALGGVFFVSTFTVVPASLVIFSIAKELSPIGVAISAGLGAVIGDYIIFRFLRDRVFDELKPVFAKLGGNYFTRLFSTPYFAWFAPVLGALIIASPFPDEVGIGLMGISKLKNWQFLSISFVLNSLGIFIIIILAKSF